MFCIFLLLLFTGSSTNTGLRDLYCVLECDRVHKARTVVRTGDLVFDWDETFELDLVDNRELDFLIYSWDPQYRHKLCYKVSFFIKINTQQKIIVCDYIYIYYILFAYYHMSLI